MKGKIIEKYRILKELGKGGMGTVYLAEHIVLETRHALKMLHFEFSADKSFRDRFVKEAKAQAKVKHPNLVRITDFIESDGRIFLVSDYIDGTNLQELISSKAPFSEDEIISIITGPLEALNEAHKTGIIHRDIKPGNIIVDKNGNGFLTDFGIALIVGDESITRTGTAIGTPYYMSPEQIRHPHKVDHRTDVYAMGVVIYEMAAGEVPFGGATDFDIKEGHIYHQPPMEKIQKRISEKMICVLKKALEKNREDRFSGCGEMRRALTEGEEPAAAAASPAVKEIQKQKPGVKAKKPSAPAPRTKLYTKKVICDWNDMEMVLVPEGEFLMGSVEDDRNAENDEKPQHTVYLDSYYIGKYPVTNRQWAKYLKSKGIYHYRINRLLNKGLGNYPVVYISWYQAVGFTEWLCELTGKKYRLPTEAEWEKAARGTDGRLYPWGNEYPVRGVHTVGPKGFTRPKLPLGSFSSYASPYGCEDMVGYIWQWCSDRYDKDYYKNSPSRNPKGPLTVSDIIIRGGSWKNATSYIRVASRGRIYTSCCGSFIGFRCARN